jgi:hypothetical protein
MFSPEAIEKICKLNQRLNKADRLKKIKVGQTVWVCPTDYPTVKGKVMGIYEHGFNVKIKAYDCTRNIAFTWDRINTLEEGNNFAR